MASHTQTGARFEDFDRKDVFDRVQAGVTAEGCRNFVLDLGPKRALIAQDLEAEDFEGLLGQSSRDAEAPIRWINIWDPSAQKETVDVIGTAYQFSPRLVSLMKYATDIADTAKKQTSTREAAVKAIISQDDIEMGLPPAAHDMVNFWNVGEDVELYILLKDTVNYSSIDQTGRALCIGAHWLHRRPESAYTAARDLRRERRPKMMPPKHWMWLVICHDNTIISFHDRPAVEQAPDYLNPDQKLEWRQECLRSIRLNTLNVLLQQSREGYGLFERDPLSQNLVRLALERRYQYLRRRPTRSPSELTTDSSTDSHLKELAKEGASNLFYYLFEDYAAASPLKHASDVLRDLTPTVLKSESRHMKRKTSDIIPELHHLRKDLRELKNLFQNYRSLIEKILANTSTLKDSAFGSQTFDPMGQSMTHISDPTMDFGEGQPIPLTKTARDRFDRLSDRLQGLMLNTIEGYLEEASALSNTYFNLLSQKNSTATAKVNSSTTLLAKLSVFFLPISFVTSYFSVQIEGLFKWWSPQDYWYSFAVIASLSFLGLFFFGRLLMFISDWLDETSSSFLRWCRDRGVHSAERLQEWKSRRKGRIPTQLAMQQENEAREKTGTA